MASEAVRLLMTIHAQAYHACDSAPKGMLERWAKEYVRGDHGKRQEEMNELNRQGKYAGENNEGGVSLIRIVNCYNVMLDAWKRIPDLLPDTSGHDEAQGIYNAFDKVTDEYWAILRRTAEGLRQTGTQQYIGKQFQRILETHHKAFNDAVPKLVAETESLGKEKHAKMQEWYERSQPKFEDAINAAKGK